MTKLYKYIDGEQIELTAEEYAANAAATAAYEADAPKRAALKEIARLEAEITPRRTREALLGTDNGWLANQDNLINQQRSLL